MTLTWKKVVLVGLLAIIAAAVTFIVPEQAQAWTGMLAAALAAIGVGMGTAKKAGPKLILIGGALALAGCGTVNQQTVDAMGVDSQASGAHAGFMDAEGNQSANYQGAAPTLIKQDAAGTWATFPGASTVLTFNPDTKMTYIMSPKDVTATDIEYDPATGKVTIGSFGARITDVASVQAGMLGDAMAALQGLTQTEAEARIEAMQAAGTITASVGEMLLEYFVPRLPAPPDQPPDDNPNDDFTGPLLPPGDPRNN